MSDKDQTAPDALEALAEHLAEKYAWNPPAQAADELEEMYEIGKRDGHSDAVQEIDLATGGDGEYRYCMGAHDPDRHCPEPATMKARIIGRFEAAEAKLKEQAAEIERLTKQGYELTQKLAKTQLRAEASEGRAFRAQLQRDEAEARANRAEAEIERLRKLLDTYCNELKARADRAHDDAIELAAMEAAIFGDEGIARHIRALKKGSDK